MDEEARKAVRTAEAEQAEIEACLSKPPLTDGQRDQALLDVLRASSR
jgi:hypothetical protein